MIGEIDNFKTPIKYYKLVRRLRNIRSGQTKDLQKKKRFLSNIEGVLLAIISEKEIRERKRNAAQEKLKEPPGKHPGKWGQEGRTFKKMPNKNKRNFNHHRTRTREEEGATVITS